jgi:mRNA interferase RelE/StbE
MTSELIFSEEALSALRKLDNATAERIIEKLEEASGNPTHFFERLAGREEYKLRAGDYRILARIFISEKKIFLLSLGHRKNIYKRR